MNRTLVRCAILGGLVAFVWGAFSWMALPVHKHCLLKFKNESQVADVIKDNAQEGDWIYILPNTMQQTQDVRYKDLSRTRKMLAEGPFMFASVRTHGLGKMSLLPFIFSMVTQVIGAFIITWMLLQTRISAFGKKVGFVTLFGLGVGVLSQLPDANWWGFSWSYTLVGMVDLVIAWFLAGLVIAKFSKVK